MADRDVLTPRQAKELLEEATRSGSPPRPEGLSLADLEAAASEVGIDGAELRKAAARLERRRGSRLGLLFVGVAAATIASALLVLPNGLTRGWRHGTLSLHNEQRHRSVTLEVWAPRPGSTSKCDVPPRRRLEAASYCLAQRIHLEPRQRARLKIPRRPSACPQVWVRTRGPGGVSRDALFTLPAAIEIDRHGRLDQKGMGRPHMHPPPEGAPSPKPCSSDNTKPGGTR